MDFVIFNYLQSIIIDNLTILVGLISASIPLIIFYLKRSETNFSISMERKRVIDFFLSIKEVRKTLGIDELQKAEENDLKKSVLILTSSILIVSFIGYLFNYIEILLLLSLILNIVLFAGLVLWMALSGFINFFFSIETFLRYYKAYRIILYLVVAIGIFSSFVSYSKMDLLLLLSVYFFLPIIVDFIIITGNRKYLYMKKITDELSRKFNKLPTAEIIYLDDFKISGKIKNIYEPNSLILQKGKKRIMVPWKGIRTIQY